MSDFPSAVVDDSVDGIVAWHQWLQGEADVVRASSGPYHKLRLLQLREAMSAFATSGRLQSLTNDDDAALAFWRLVESGQLDNATQKILADFKGTICSFLAVQASSAASERLFSAAKFVADGRYSLGDAKFERALIMRCYLARRVVGTDETAYHKVVAQLASKIIAAREEEAATNAAAAALLLN